MEPGVLSADSLSLCTALAALRPTGLPSAMTIQSLIEDHSLVQIYIFVYPAQPKDIDCEKFILSFDFLLQFKLYFPLQKCIRITKWLILMTPIVFHPHKIDTNTNTLHNKSSLCWITNLEFGFLHLAG